MFRVIVAGSRGFSDYPLLCKKLDFFLRNYTKDSIIIVSGMARGADQLAVRYAMERGFLLNEFPADWSLGRSAGYQRNILMAENADALVAFWDGESRGTKHMIEIAKRKELKIRVVRY